MKRLLTLDAKDYTDDLTVVEKYTVRAIICKDGLYAMQQSGAGEYKIPGGGMEGDESYIETLKREVLEETGLVVIPESVKEIGEILEVRRDIFDKSVKYINHTYFFYCDVKDEEHEVCMTKSEIEKGFHPVWVSAKEIIDTNRQIANKVTSERDTSFMELLLNNLHV